MEGWDTPIRGLRSVIFIWVDFQMFLIQIYLTMLCLPEERYSETSVNKISTRRHIPEDGILHSHRSENLRSYTLSTSM
jgi:hypothetical protein